MQWAQRWRREGDGCAARHSAAAKRERCWQRGLHSCSRVAMSTALGVHELTPAPRLASVTRLLDLAPLPCPLLYGSPATSNKKLCLALHDNSGKMAAIKHGRRARAAVLLLLAAAAAVAALPSPVSSSSLVMVYSIQRHGARNVLPKSSHLVESEATGGPTLLPAGQRQCYDAGAPLQFARTNANTPARTENAIGLNTSPRMQAVPSTRATSATPRAARAAPASPPTRPPPRMASPASRASASATTTASPTRPASTARS